MSKLLFAAVWLFAFVPLASASDEWRFGSSEGPNGNTVFLSESPSTAKGCTGKKEASEQMFALGKWTYIRELCYELDNAGKVKLTDPAKMMFFNTFTMSASSFKTIPTEKERAEANQHRIAEENFQAIKESIRQYNEGVDRRRQEIRRPTICNRFGDGLICD